MKTFAAASVGLLIALAALPAHAADAWPFSGGGLANARDAGGGIGDPAKLQLQWSTKLKGAVRVVTPVSDGTALYLPTALGYVSKIDRKTGHTIWSAYLPDLTGIPGAFSKNNVAVADDAIVVGLQNTAVVVGLDRDSGAFLWKTKIDDHPAAVVTQSPIIAGGKAFIGVAGLGEEVQASYPTYKCCSFRGAMLALDLKSGKILWKTHTLPEGFAGGSVWSSTPALDEKRHTLYIGTGNGFFAPPEVQACIDKNHGNERALIACYPPDVWYDSILALDPDTGRVKWGHRLDDYDIFTGACLVPENGAPDHCGHGDDWDFGNGPMLWEANGHDLVGAGQKAGIFWALDRDTGAIVWRRSVGPGGPNGGIEYGSAVAGGRVFVAESDGKQVGHAAAPYTLPSGQTIKYGSFAALDAATGKIDWQIPDPAGAAYPGTDKPCKLGGPKADCEGAFPMAPITVAGNAVFACSNEPEGHFYAFDAATGRMLWNYKSGASCVGGASVIGDTLYWASGRTLYAFAAHPPPAVTDTFIVSYNPTTASGVFTAAQAEHGRAVYQASCSTACHMSNLAGAAPTPELAGDTFLSRWDGLTLADLYRKIATTMPKGAPGSLKPDDYLAATGFILQANGFPAGPSPLTADLATLDKIEIAKGR